MQFIKPKPLPLIITLVAAITMFTMCGWQIKRLIWKEALIASIEQANSSAPLTALPTDPQDIPTKRFYRIELRGEYLRDSDLHIAARYYKSQLGYHVFTPFRVETGEFVMVNRGWIPAKQKDMDVTPPVGEQLISAQIRTKNDRNPFTPANQPEKNVWFGRDVADMGGQLGLKLAPLTIDLIGTQGWDSFPIPTTGQIKLRNDHLGYAITWFLIGLAVVVIGLLYHRKKE